MSQQTIQVIYQFSIQDQLTYYENFQNLPEVLNWQQFLQFNEETERQFLRSDFQKCPLPSTEQIEITDINIHKLQETASGNFYDYQAMNAIRCIMNTFIYEHRADKFPVGARYWLRDLFRISDDSAEGLVFSGNFLGSEMFVIKSALRKEQSLQHEFVVGSIINQIRRYIPNFVFTYSGFSCSPPINSKNKVSDWCRTGSEQVNYLLLENVQGAETLYSYLLDQRNNPLQILHKLVQVLLALQVAQEKFQFTHFDLHIMNILLRKVPNMSEMQISYSVGEKIFYLRTNTVATIIDYGYSCIRLPNGEMVGRWDLAGRLAIHPNKCFPFYDMFRLLCNLLQFSLQYRPDVFQYIQPLFYFFMRDTTAQDFILFNKPLFMSNGSLVDAYVWKTTAPYNEVTAEIKPYDLLDYILQQYPGSLDNLISETSWPEIPFLACQGQCQPDVKSALQSFNIHQNYSEDLLLDTYNFLLSHYDLTNPENFRQIRERISSKFFAALLRRIREHDITMFNKSQRELRETPLPQTLDMARLDYNKYLELLNNIYNNLRKLMQFREHAEIIVALSPIYEDSPQIMNIVGEISTASQILKSQIYLQEIAEKLQFHSQQISNYSVHWKDKFQILYNAIQSQLDQLLGKYTPI